MSSPLRERIIAALTSSRSSTAAWCAWGGYAAVRGVLGALSVRTDPATGALFAKGSVTDNYRLAAHAWTHGEQMYFPGARGWLYPPQGAMVFVPFEVLPMRIGEAAWRAASIGLMAWGAWRLAAALALIAERTLSNASFPSPGQPALARSPHPPLVSAATFFPLLTLLLIASCDGSARNGQVNLPLAACLALAAAACVRAALLESSPIAQLDPKPLAHAAANRAAWSWWEVSGWCLLGLMLKIIMIVPILLCAAVFLRRLGWRLLIITGVFAVLPFAHPDLQYVATQYELAFAKVKEAFNFRGDQYADLGGALTDLGLTPPEPLMQGIRVLAAALTLALCGLAARRLGPARAGVAILCLGAPYLMLMNARTEGVSYCILAVPVAALGAWEIVNSRRVPTRAGVAGLTVPLTLIALAILLVAAHVITGPIFGRSKDFLLRPLCAAAFYGLVSMQLVRGSFLAPLSPAERAAPDVP
ncbi:hypothetical protein BH11PLA1_BH11PLA1_18730 [soil metagenome]